MTFSTLATPVPDHSKFRGYGPHNNIMHHAHMNARIITPRACARGKVIGRVIVVDVVSTKIAIS